jgi:hypothetical protein
MITTLPTDRSERILIVRIWYELDGVTSMAQWRGSVQSAATAERRYFASWQEMAGYLAELAAGSDENLPPSFRLA